MKNMKNNKFSRKPRPRKGEFLGDYSARYLQCMFGSKKGASSFMIVKIC